jgi:hypothetical protein
MPSVIYAECHYAEPFMLSVVVLNDIMLSSIYAECQK